MLLGIMEAEQRSQIVLNEFMVRARAAGERAISVARCVVAALTVLRMLVVGPPLKSGSPRDWLLLGVLALACLSSVVINVLVKRVKETSLPRIVSVSVGLDAFLVIAALAILVAWPYAGYDGLIRSPSVGLVICVLFAAAVRFSLPLVLLSISACGIGLASLIGYEIGVVHRGFLLEEAITVGIVFVAASTMALAIVLRSRRLVVQGAAALVISERVAHRLGAYVPRSVAERARGRSDMSLGGSRQPVTCLFTDLRGFTSYAETLPPEQLVSEVNAYFAAMVAAVATEGGVVDKFIGDAMMVVFGVPTSHVDDSARAIRAARAMQRALEAHNQERRGKGLPPLVQGIGIHGGSAVVGNIGTESRMQHTVMGSVVNVASRLEHATKEVGVGVLVSAVTVEAARLSKLEVPPLRPLPDIVIRGVREPVAIYCFPDDEFSLENLPDSDVSLVAQPLAAAPKQA